MTIGFLKIDLNKKNWLEILKVVRNNNPNSIGSVGKAISVFKIGIPKSVKETENGVRNTIRKNKYL